MESLLNFIKTHTALNHSQLAIESGINIQLFNQWVKGKRSLSETHIPKLTEVLKNYGYEEPEITSTLTKN